MIEVEPPRIAYGEDTDSNVSDCSGKNFLSFFCDGRDMIFRRFKSISRIEISNSYGLC